MMQLVNENEHDFNKKIENTKKILDSLPSTNWFSRSSGLHTDHLQYGDIGIYDLFLHSQDRAYSIPELYNWLEQCGLALIEFSSHKLRYDNARYIKDRELLKLISSKPKKTRQAFAELISGAITKHTFYCATASDCVADINDEDVVPFLVGDRSNKDIVRELSKANNSNVLFENEEGKLTIEGRPFSIQLFKHLDGRNTVQEIMKNIIKELGLGDDAYNALFGEFKRAYRELNKLDFAYLRHKSTPNVSNMISPL